jgi:Fe-S cluster biogenesis protein NfuA
MAVGTADFPSPQTGAASPLARRLFAIPEVAAVFLGADFITVTKVADADWQVMKPAVLGAIMEHFTSGDPVMSEAAGPTHADAADGDDEIVSQIIELLDTRVRPAVAMDGGDIVFHGFEDGVVYLHMQGSCAGCPSSSATLKMGIENMLRHYIPEVREVQPVL